MCYTLQHYRYVSKQLYALGGTDRAKSYIITENGSAGSYVACLTNAITPTLSHRIKQQYALSGTLGAQQDIVTAIAGVSSRRTECMAVCYQ